MGARAGTPVAIMVGRVAPEKNFGLGVEVFELLRAKVPDVRCVVVGDGPSRGGWRRRIRGFVLRG